MIKWYDLSLIYLGSGIALVLINLVYRIIPPKTRNGWIVLTIAMMSIVGFWWFVAAPYIGFELSSSEQWKHLSIAALVQYPMNYFLFLPLLKD
jgi:hypothetical protein